jgi:Ca2+/Na+ antiporter
MNSLFKSITDLPKRYLKIILAKISALIVLFALLILLTIFAAFVMITRWHWSEGLSLSVCFAPWLIAFLTLIIYAQINSVKFEQEKQQVYAEGKKQFFIQIVGIILALLRGRKNKKAKKALAAKSKKHQ